MCRALSGVFQAYLQESIANSNTNSTTLDNCALDVESCGDGHVTGRDDIEAALSGRISLTNSALQVSNDDDVRLSAVVKCLCKVII